MISGSKWTRETCTAGMTFYDPFAALWPVSQDVARQSVVILNALNFTVAANCWRFGFRIGPVATVFQTNNFSSNPSTGLPANYTKACLWTLTLICQPPDPPNIHPNPVGYQVIADSCARPFRPG